LFMIGLTPEKVLWTATIGRDQNRLNEKPVIQWGAFVWSKTNDSLNFWERPIKMRSVSPESTEKKGFFRSKFSISSNRIKICVASVGQR
jgi:hypothetical protein